MKQKFRLELVTKKGNLFVMSGTDEECQSRMKWMRQTFEEGIKFLQTPMKESLSALDVLKELMELKEEFDNFNTNEVYLRIESIIDNHYTQEEINYINE